MTRIVTVWTRKSPQLAWTSQRVEKVHSRITRQSPSNGNKSTERGQACEDEALSNKATGFLEIRAAQGQALHTAGLANRHAMHRI